MGSLRIRSIAALVAIVIASSLGCQIGKGWRRLTGNERSPSEVSPQSDIISRSVEESDAAAASLRAASDKIDKAATSPEAEPRSYYSGGQDIGISNSRTTCTSGCCK